VGAVLQVKLLQLFSQYLPFALGFEHSIAKMYFISFALMLLEDPNIYGILQQSGISIDLSNLNMNGFFYNLLFVTLGNIVGGSIFIGFTYWI
jgi:formate/nitrite transporter FocA (FNT family)